MAGPVITRVYNAPDTYSTGINDVAGSVRVSGTADPGLTIRISVDGATASFAQSSLAYPPYGPLNVNFVALPGTPLSAGTHFLSAVSYASAAATTPLAVSAPVEVEIGTSGADDLQGLVIGSTITGPSYILAAPGSDTITAYTVVDGASRTHASGGVIEIDGGFASIRFPAVAQDTDTDTVVIPAALSALASHHFVNPSPGFGPTALGPEIVVSTADATLHLANIEKLHFSDALVTIQNDVLTDFLYYDARYPDLAAADVNARAHYETSGWHEGRDPNAYFSTSGYLNTYVDVKAAGVNPLDHYIGSGWKEGRDPSANFDTALYLKFNPDVASNPYMNPLVHYLNFGITEGRKFSPVVDSAHLVSNGFDATYYKLANPDVAAAGVDPLQHYLATGWQEGRNPDAFFDTNYYLTHNPDVAAAGVNPLLHYMTDGWREGRDPSSHFDTTTYLEHYPDVAAAGVNPFLHFLQSGIAEGRSGFGDLF